MKGKRTKKVLISSFSIIFIIIIVGILFLVKSANRLIKVQLESYIGEDFSIQSLDLNWGSIELTGITLRNKSHKEVIKIERATIKADFIGILKKRYIISEIAIDSPYILFERNEKGDIVNPTLPVKPSKEKKEERPDQSVKTEQISPIHIKRLYLKDGKVEYIDRKTFKPPVVIYLRDIELECKDIIYPLSDNPIAFRLFANIPTNLSKGNIKGNGQINPLTKDTRASIKIRDLDLSPFKSLLEKGSYIRVTRCILDLDMDLKIASKRINAPCKATMKDLEIEAAKGFEGKVMGWTAAGLVETLKDKDGKIHMSFVISGDLNNPDFSLKERIINTIIINIAERLGVPFKKIGGIAVETGVKGVDKATETIKNVGKSLEGLFK